MDFINYKETGTLENAYAKFGKVMHVDRWFKADCFRAPAVRNADETGKVKILKRTISKKTGKPMWWLPALQLEVKRWERLKMDTPLNFSICICNDKPIYTSFSTAFELEKIASKDSRKDWRVEIIDAFESLTYQRQGRKKWILVEMGKGYA